jgi:hypothetical protein
MTTAYTARQPKTLQATAGVPAVWMMVSGFMAAPFARLCLNVRPHEHVSQM